MTPQLVDLNADGHQDLVAATFEGTAFFVEGTEEGWKEPVHIVDENDSLVRISYYWDLEDSEYQSVDRSAEGEDYHEDHHMTSIALVDWDEDGDLDLIQGAYEGALYRCMNEGTPSEPKFSSVNHQIKADGEHLTLDGGLATPRVCDWDGDGLFDILCGGSKGGVYFYKNTGKKGEPQFAAAQTLVEKTIGKMKTDQDESSNLNTYYTSRMVPSRDGYPTCPGTSFHIDVADYDDDGDLDLLVGAQSFIKPEQKELTDDEKEELAELQEKQTEIRNEMMALYRDKEGEERRQVLESEEYRELSKEYSKGYLRMQELKPTPRSKNYLWLYRNSQNHSSPSSAQSGEDFAPGEFAVRASFEPSSASPGDPVELNVMLRIPEGFHIYGSKNPRSATTIELVERGGLKGGEIEVPTGNMVIDKGQPSWWLQDVVMIRHSMTAPASFDTATVKGKIRYTMCDEQACRPPATQEFSANLNRK